ncbi:MAG: 1-phosphofructokinase family hexose kinase [Clostridiaceae bacterium]|nr:1-phosphofructokinase family hexose kinase [Clostridiaceae bacterium]
MIYTVTLNPAIDKVIFLKGFIAKGMNRAERTVSYPGGKGNNVAQVIHQMGGQVMALGFVSGTAGRFVEDALARKGVRFDFVHTTGETRTNTKIIDELDSCCTEVNEPGPAITSTDLLMLENKMLKLVREKDVVVLSGSLPSGVSDDIYQKWILVLKNLKVRVILDADGEALRLGIQAVPRAVKPNIYEWKRLFSQDNSIIAPLDIARMGALYAKKGVKYQMVSLGKNGAVLIDKEHAYYARPFHVDVVNTVGAGDAMTAALAMGIHDRSNSEQLLRIGSAYAIATVASSQYESLTIAAASEIAENLEIETLY